MKNDEVIKLFVAIQYAGFSHAEIAKSLKTTRQTVFKVIHGKIPPSAKLKNKIPLLRAMLQSQKFKIEKILLSMDEYLEP